MKTQINKSLLSLAGEYRVCSELCKRGIFSTVTYGNHKGVDLYAVNDKERRVARIEVKTSQGTRFITRFTQKYGGGINLAPDFWVLVSIDWDGKETFAEEFYILRHAEMKLIQDARNQPYVDSYQQKHGKAWNSSTGVDNVLQSHVCDHRNQWQKIAEFLKIA